MTFQRAEILNYPESRSESCRSDSLQMENLAGIVHRRNIRLSEIGIIFMEPY